MTLETGSERDRVFVRKFEVLAQRQLQGRHRKFYENQRRGHTILVTPQNYIPLKSPMRGRQKKDPRFVDFFRPLIFFAKNLTLAPIFSHF
jgi:hypothetical protein